MNIAEFCSELDLQLGMSTPAERLEIAGKFVSKAYKVTPQELAIFFVDPQQEQLKFIWPEKLKSSGAIPLNAKNSLVAKTLREKKGYIDNHFARSAHGVVFEAFSGGPPIQKIISAPLLSGGAAKGVIQVSRKGADLKSAGPDFGPNELKALQKMAEVIVRHI